MELVVDVVDLALEALLLLLEPVALLADLLEPLAAALHLLGVLRVERRGEESDEHYEHCHPERSEGSCRTTPTRGGQDPLAALGMTVSLPALHIAQVPPHAHQAPREPQQHAEHQDDHHVLGTEEDQPGERSSGGIAEEQIPGVAEHQREEPAQQALNAPSSRNGPRMNQLVAPTSA